LKPLQLFWKPFGKQFVAILISHLKYSFDDFHANSFARRQKVTEEGAFVLVRDMDEYHNVISIIEILDKI
jgi:hypothetical protein